MFFNVCKLPAHSNYKYAITMALNIDVDYGPYLIFVLILLFAAILGIKSANEIKIWAGFWNYFFHREDVMEELLVMLIIKGFLSHSCEYDTW